MQQMNAQMQQQQAKTAQEKSAIAEQANSLNGQQLTPELALKKYEIDKKTGQPPPRLAPFLDRAKLHNLPWIMFTDSAGVVKWEGQIPTTAAELTNLIKQYGG